MTAKNMYVSDYNCALEITGREARLWKLQSTIPDVSGEAREARRGYLRFGSHFWRSVPTFTYFNDDRREDWWVRPYQSCQNGGCLWKGKLGIKEKQTFLFK